MEWDQAPIYRARRRFALLAALGMLLVLVLGTTALVRALRSPGEPSDAEAPVAWQRTGKAPAITIAFAGDTQAHGSAGRINEVGLGGAGEVLAAADLAMVNLETVVAKDRAGMAPEPKTFTFATGPKILDSLQQAGVDVVTAANNHGMDYGVEGMRRMLEVKQNSPIPIVGIGKDDAEAWAPWTTEVQGRKVVVLGATDVLDDHLDWKAGPDTPGLAKVRDEDGFAKLVDQVEHARAAGPDDVVVVYLHSGTELVRCPRPRQQETARALAAAGADVVVGSHAHILQTTTSIGQTAVAYGLGNFVFGSGRADTRATGVLTVTIPGSNTAPTLDFAPARISNGLPVMLEGAERDKAIESWQALGEGCG